MESKREKFVRLAEARTNKIIKMIELLGNLSDTRTYEYNEDDINKIYNSIFTELNISKDKFDIHLRKKNYVFKLTDGGGIDNNPTRPNKEDEGISS